MINKKIQVIGVPLDMGAGVMGTRLGPDAIRLTWFIDTLRNLGYEVQDLGNISIDNLNHYSRGKFSKERLDIILPAIRELADIVESSINDDNFPLVLGGDHTLVVGSFSGILRSVNRPGLIYFDAHADINTPQSSISGNSHGIPISELMGLSKEGVLPVSRKSNLKTEDIVYVGLNDVDPGEVEILEDNNILSFTKQDVDSIGITEVMDRAITRLRDTDGIYISLDVDSLDKAIAPGTGLPNVDGLLKSDVLYALNRLRKENLLGMEFVETNPLMDNNNQTAQLVRELILEVLSYEYIG